MLRYLLHDIPIESFGLEINVKNQELASVVEKWIRNVASKRCFKELSLTILYKIESFTLPVEIFSGKNLDTKSITDNCGHINPLSISGNSVINCMSLRELKLANVNICEELLNTVLSTCKLLEKIHISLHPVLKKIKVKSLHFLQELKLSSAKNIIMLEINDVPNLRLFYYHTVQLWSNPPPFNIDSLEKVTDLWLSGVIMYDTFFDMIKLKFPYLERLGIQTGCSSQKRFDFTCASLKSLTISSLENEQVDTQVYAPNLQFFRCKSDKVPILSFPAITPKKINLILSLRDHINCSFLLNMRKALNISSTFDIEINSAYTAVPVPSYINFDDLRMFTFPSMNVQTLSLQLYSDSDRYFEEHSRLFDAFFFICHPDYIEAYRDRPFKDNKLYKKMVRWMVEKKMPDLIDVEIENPHNGEWETLTSSWTSYPLSDWDSIEFKLNWRSR